MKSTSNKTILNLTIKTQTSETNGLYDYTSNESAISEKNIQLKESFYIIRKNNDIFKIDQNYQFKDETIGQILFYARKSLKNNHNFEIVNPISKKKLEKNKSNIDDLNRRPWLIVNSKNAIYNENEDYNVQENDIIKLGDVKYEIIKKSISVKENKDVKSDDQEEYNISKMNKERGSIFNIDIKKNQYRLNENIISIKKEIKEDYSSNNNSFKNNLLNKEEREKDIKNEENEIEKCRICFETKSTKENPKIRLCSCHDFVHFECLKAYLNRKTEAQENTKKKIITYTCKNFNCEVCYKPYPLRFRIPEYDRIYELIDLNKPSELDYIILESLDFIKDNINNLKIIHVVTLNEDEIKIGRNELNDIIDPDISVSRKHAILKFNKKTGKLNLENLSEKYGTLILIKGNIKMKEKKIHIQVGKSYIQAHLKKDKSDLTDSESKCQADTYNSEYISSDYSNIPSHSEEL